MKLNIHSLMKAPVTDDSTAQIDSKHVESKQTKGSAY